MNIKRDTKYILFLVIVISTICGFYFYKHSKTSENSKAPSTLTNQVLEIRKNSEELVAIVDKEDPLKALQELQHRMDTDPVVFTNCHELAHQIGHEAIKKYRVFGNALEYLDTTCSDGYLHGIMEETFGEETADITALTKQMQTLCDGMGGLTKRCFHGVGHAMMYYTENNLPEALNLCGKLSGITARGKCYEGTYMQNFLTDSNSHQSQYVDFKNPILPCQTAPEKYKPYCYFYVPIFYLGQNNADYAKTIAWCEREAGNYAGTCVRGVGSLMVKYKIKEPKFGESLCATSQHVEDCIAGMASYGLTFYAHVNDVLENICEQMDETHKNMCVKDLAKYIKDDKTSTNAFLTPATIGSVTRHDAGFIDKNIRVNGYLLKQESGYAIFSDESSGDIGYYDLPISGAGISDTKLNQKYKLEGKFIKSAEKTSSNGSPFMLELSSLPQPIQ